MPTFSDKAVMRISLPARVAWARFLLIVFDRRPLDAEEARGLLG